MPKEDFPVSVRHDSDMIFAEKVHAEWSSAPNVIVARILEDKTVSCLIRLMYTVAIAMDCDMDTMSRRYCFDDGLQAANEFIKLKTCDDTPVGFISQRPKPEDEKYANQWPKLKA